MYNSLTKQHTYYVKKDSHSPKQVSKTTYYRYKRNFRIRERLNNLYGYKQHIIEVL